MKVIKLLQVSSIYARAWHISLHTGSWLTVDMSNDIHSKRWKDFLFRISTTNSIKKMLVENTKVTSYVQIK